jgi:signal transduction histidine kinase
MEGRPCSDGRRESNGRGSAARDRFRLGFAARLGAATSLLIVGVSIAHSVIVGQRDVQHLRRYLTERGLAISNQLALDAAASLASGKVARLYELAEQARAQNDVVYTRFFDRRGMLLASTGKPMSGSTGRAAVAEGRPAGPIAVGTDLWEFQAPILVRQPNGERVGTVAIGISLVSLETLRKQAFVTATLVTVLLAVLSVLGAVLVARAITRPLTALAAAADAIARGEFGAQVEVRSSDEVGRLGRSFNDMSRSLARSRETLQEYSHALEEKVRELEDANRLKSEFLATVSHELRTPLNVIIGYVEMLTDGADGTVSAGQAEMLGAIRKYSKLQLDLITNVLDFSRLSSGPISFHVERFGLGPLLDEIRMLYASRVQASGIRFGVAVDPRVSDLETDRIKVQEIVRNLVDNAVKFTEQGAVDIDARPGTRPGSVSIVVADTGPGIRPEDVAHIFEPFHQIGDSSTRRTGGVGLGLSIVKQLVDALGGAISVSSRVGEGSIFRFELPARLPVRTTEEVDAGDALAALDTVARNAGAIDSESSSPPRPEDAFSASSSDTGAALRRA